MILDRILIAFLITAVVLSILVAWRWWHKRRVQKIIRSETEAPDRPSILYFRGDSCSICPTQSMFLEKLQTEWGAERFLLRTIDAEKEQDTAVKFGILSLPTTIILNATGDVKHINYGLTNHQKLAQQLENIT